jgi:hypothetical protein
MTLTAPTTHTDERAAYATFASLYAEEEYRARLAELYATWREFNDDFFNGELVEPHLVLGRTASRCLGHCSATTGYGARCEITLAGPLVFGTNTDWVIRPWPHAAGTKQFIDDLLLRLTVRQFVLEVDGVNESGYRGFGPRFVKRANSISTRLRLSPVVARRRGTDTTSPLAHGWPHCVRPASYYGDDVTERALELARGNAVRQAGVAHTPSAGAMELVLFLLNHQRVADAQRMITRHLEWVHAFQESRWQTRRRVEAGLADVDGKPLGQITFSPEWLKWNGGTVQKIAASIHASHTFEDLPILADALEEAGCVEERILRHLRERMEHGPRCWVLRLLLTLAGE